MALHQLWQLTPFPVSTVARSFPSSGYNSQTLLSRNHRLPCQVQCMVATKTSCTDQTIVRRSASYQTPIWDYDVLQSLRSEYEEESYTAQAKKLKEDVKVMLDKALHPLDQLELIDTLQRLGLACYFEDEIRSIIENIFNKKDTQMIKDDNLYGIALEFRLLRQHGYNVPQDVFNGFKDEHGLFKASLCDDIKGLLHLYEASYLLVDGENLLEDARDFAAKHLKEYVKVSNKDQYLSMLVNHALEIPLHWRTPRMEARWFIDVYAWKQGCNPVLLDLAKLDFNIVQAKYQDDIRDATRWWNDLDIGSKLSYIRDRLMENALWTVGEVPEPQFGYLRKMSIRIHALVTATDDCYDVYGTVDELELLTDVITRWDVNAAEKLPYYMKISFLALFNSINDMAYVILREKGMNVIPYLKKLWGDLCQAYLQEAKWYSSGYTPTLQEYLDNGWMSSSGQAVLGHFFFIENPVTEEASKLLVEYPNVIRHSVTILRLANDLGTSSYEIARGDVPKTIQCYMHETGATEEEAREHTKHLIYVTWKKLNKELLSAESFMSKAFIEHCVNLARSALYFYWYGDAYGVQDSTSKERLMLMLVEPIPLKN